MLAKALDWLDRHARWSSLRLYGNAPLVRSTILIPVLGYFLLLNANLVEWLQLHAPWVPGSSFDVGWKILCFYYGSLVLAAGTSLFAWWCPRPMKKYAGPVEFSGAELTFFTAGEHFNHLRAMVFSEHDSMNERQRRMPELNGMDATAHEAGCSPRSQRDQLAIQMLTQHWHWHDTQHMAVRITILLLFFFGSGLVLSPSLWTIGQVTASTLTYWAN
jgi:hypothetical protein